MQNDFIQPEDVTEITGISSTVLARLRYQGRGPKFYKPTPRTVLYRRDEVIDWVIASAQSCTGSPSRMSLRAEPR